MKLRSLSANFPEFRTINFRDGLNIIVADRASEATKTDSRNGLGKTTIIALIDFCLGSNMNERLRQMSGNEWCFTLSFTTRTGLDIEVSRSPDNPAEIHIDGEVVAAGVVKQTDASETGDFTIGVRHWTTWLGNETFIREGMPANPPSFRSLIRHLMRYSHESLIDAFRTVSNQSAETIQSENAYFLNLDWQFAKEWQKLKDQKKRVALADDPDDSIESQISALEPRIARAELRSERLAQDISRFSVLPEYREVERRVQTNTDQLKALGNDILLDRQQLALYESQLSEDFTDSHDDVKALFTEAGIVLGDAVVRSLNEAAEFQKQVTENRVAYLNEELRRIRERIGDREIERIRIASQQEKDLKLLQSGGALDDLVELQRSLAEAQVDAAHLAEEMETLRQLSIRKSKLKSDEMELRTRTTLDLQERFSSRAGILARFGEIMESLYAETADLRVSLGRTGVKFGMDLPKTGSGGVHLMAIFAYDIAVSENLASHGRGPNFLIHDSSIFADVDERQVARAIEIAAVSVANFGYQYIFTMNSDSIPWLEFKDQEFFKDAVVMQLHDGDQSGSVLGQRIQPLEEEDEN